MPYKDRKKRFFMIVIAVFFAKNVTKECVFIGLTTLLLHLTLLSAEAQSKA